MRKQRITLRVVVLLALLVAAVGFFWGHSDISHPTRDDKTLRVVMLGSQNETLEYGQAQTYFPWAVMGNVCDVLVRWRNGRLEYQLATAIEPNEDATRWTIRLRPDVYFSDGSRLSATNVLTSLQQLSQSIGFGSFFQDVDFAQ
ncbi:ABC transporter substrate-binding protein, partial [Candidatus Symbiopectobacterium sp. NZEC135]